MKKLHNKFGLPSPYFHEKPAARFQNPRNTCGNSFNHFEPLLATVQGKMRLMAQGDHEFALEVDPEIRVTFEVSRGQAASLTLNAGGGEQTAKRVK